MKEPSERMSVVDNARSGRNRQSRAVSPNAFAQDSHGARLPAVLDVPEAAHVLGIGRTLAYELVRTNQWPTPVIRIGRLIKIPTQPLLDLVSTGWSATAAG